ncbi:ATP-binding cassette domain-containing protein [Herbidospora mongoliensis]|uniref:ATP-binding cassette domain-containing protein n=1 Tax=Herbidospora mongoliensis TaxID=688067 RepID=UPI0023B92FC6|nr:ATP-binding cassette domain-containing protein [Herbidospora mongoliensis]
MTAARMTTGSATPSPSPESTRSRPASPTGTAPPSGRPAPPLSGGEHQRVSIARALLKPTPIPLVDDPLPASPR